METSVYGVLFLFFLQSYLHVSGAAGAGSTSLSYDFYKETCPNLENHIMNGLTQFITSDIITTPSALLRLFFHDCQVQGCDASILVDSGGEESEIRSDKNFAIRKREVIGMLKKIMEKECPRQVSCADILVLSARDAVWLAGGPFISVPLGRRDSTSPPSKHLADVELPSADIGVNQMLPLFINKGLSVAESVAIMGGHSLGVSHCKNILSRLTNPSRGVVSSGFQAFLALSCSGALNPNTTFIINDQSPIRFDQGYYKDIKSGRGVLRVDTELPSDPRTAPFVDKFAADKNEFNRVFSSAFVKVSTWGVLTGQQGSIREYCHVNN
ncbi:peroxidase 29 [Impatiens glandulifera]|uniref:peroxidase 29 n=1 Tax=Impatiens glandulifera TaxID=253017 RepID=UPI001FB1235F|nr:peroxidase 29 [Impatiens glandulifera]